jgi:hypothetical protein
MIQNQHLTDLERALGQLREQRRNWVRTLAAGAGHERGKTESAIESFLKCQRPSRRLEGQSTTSERLCPRNRSRKRLRSAAQTISPISLPGPRESISSNVPRARSRHRAWWGAVENPKLELAHLVFRMRFEKSDRLVQAVRVDMFPRALPCAS